MAVATTVQQKVSSGQTQEYFYNYYPVNDGDELVFTFDTEFTLEDLLISSTDTIAYDIKITYPASRSTWYLDSGLTGTYQMNSANMTTPSKKWFRFPPNSSLRFIANTFATGVQLSVLVIGR